MSRSGAFVASEWQDSVGVLTKTVMDAAHVLTTIAGMSVLDRSSRSSWVTYLANTDHKPQGTDPEDSSSQPDPRDALARARPADGTDFRQFCNASALKGMRVAVCFPASSPII